MEQVGISLSDCTVTAGTVYSAPFCDNCMPNKDRIVKNPLVNKVQ